MRMIIAVIQPTRLQAVRKALYEAGVRRITICDSQEFVDRDGQKLIDGQIDYRAPVQRKVTLEIAVNDDFLDRTVAIIQDVTNSGEHGDGKIFILPLADVVEFAPVVRGESAI